MGEHPEDGPDMLDLALGQVHRMLGEDGALRAQTLVAGATLNLRRDGGRYYPIPGNNWDADTFEAVVGVDPGLVDEFTPEVHDRVWSKLEAVLRGQGREDVQSMVVEGSVPPLPEIDPDWREQAARAIAPGQPLNQGRAERDDPTAVEADGLRFRTAGELVVYELLCALQQDMPSANTIAIVPGSGVRLRDSGVRTPDFLVIGNGRAVVIEVDGGKHYGSTRKADDADRDIHWSRCSVHTVRIADHHTRDRVSLASRLREEVRRRLWPPR